MRFFFVEGDRVVAQAVQFFAAGFETTSAAISFTLYELALNKDIQDRVRKEIMSTFNGKEIDYDGLQSMKYLQKVVSGKRVVLICDRVCIIFLFLFN